MRLFMSRGRLPLTLVLAVAGAAIGVAAAVSPASAMSSARTSASAAVSASAVAPAAAEPAALNAVACRTVSDCMAVGANTPTMPTQLAADRWNGKKWSRVAMPKPAGVGSATADGVACPANRECVAVGVAYPVKGTGPYALAAHWNGARWTTGKAATPGSSSFLTAISCPTTASCYAVGQYTPKGKTSFTALIEHWNGKNWAQQAAPLPHGTSGGGLLAVSCPKASFCVATGFTGSGELIERWTGKGWSATAPAAPALTSLYGVSCPTAASCFAVGGTGARTVAEKWNGKTWSKSTVPAPAGSSQPSLDSVSCVTAARCLAVGSDLTPRVFADLWNGKTWRPVSMATTGGHLGAFQQVQCLGANSCVALGSVSPFDAAWRSESAFWNGKSWKVVLTA